jgi:GNAT superfamily N-acetyltransferase
MPRSWRSAPFTMISQLDPAFFHKVLDAPETQLRVILAEDRGQVIGLMTYYPMFHLHSATSGLNLHQLFIDERYRGQGCAQQFMEYLTNAAAEFGAS